MPVAAHSGAGVALVSSGSRTTHRGARDGCMYARFTPLAVSVIPAADVSSAPERVVGTAMWASLGRSSTGRRAQAHPVDDRVVVGEHEGDPLGEVDHGAAADADETVGAGGPRLRRGLDHHGDRCVLARAGERAGDLAAQRGDHVVDEAGPRDRSGGDDERPPPSQPGDETAELGGDAAGPVDDPLPCGMDDTTGERVLHGRMLRAGSVAGPRRRRPPGQTTTASAHIPTAWCGVVGPSAVGGGPSCAPLIALAISAGSAPTGMVQTNR